MGNPAGVWGMAAGQSDASLYRYQLNLNEVVDDRLRIELRTPEIKSDTIRFYMPNIILGTYRESNYDMLIDSPLMYNRPDTTTINVANAEVLVSVYAPGGQVTSAYLAGQYKSLLQAHADYLGDGFRSISMRLFCISIIPMKSTR